MNFGGDAFPIRLRRLEATLAVCRCDPSATLEPWMSHAPFWSITRTPDELSIVCPFEVVPGGVRHEGPFAAFVVGGPLPFSLTGIVSRISGPLADGGIPVFLMATFDTDCVLVPTARVSDAREAWLAAGLAVDP